MWLEATQRARREFFEEDRIMPISLPGFVNTEMQIQSRRI